jgi:hypothetical protein
MPKRRRVTEIDENGKPTFLKPKKTKGAISGGYKKTKEVEPAWMCLYRHFGMQGGVFDCGYGFIEGVYDTFEEADARAKEVVKLSKNTIDPRIWVMRCVKTYAGGGIAISPIKDTV